MSTALGKFKVTLVKGGDREANWLHDDKADFDRRVDALLELHGRLKTTVYYYPFGANSNGWAVVDASHFYTKQTKGKDHE